MLFPLVYLFVSISILKSVTCVCELHFFIFCESFDDIKFNKTRYEWEWTNLVIQPKIYEESASKFVYNNSHLDKTVYELQNLFIINQLVKIEPQALIYSYQLKNLILYRNKLKELKAFTFFFSSKLDVLSLRNNEIEDLEKETFRDSIIDSIDLSHNEIRRLKSEVFYNCEVKKLAITHNKLARIETNSLPKSLKILHLDHNKLYNLPLEITYLRILTELSVTHNNLVDVANLQNSNLKLKRIDLSFNNIGFINDEFNNWSDLKYLDLTANQLTQFDMTIFFNKVMQNKDKFFLLLGHNYLRNLNLYENTNNKFYIYLFGNPWNCKCWQKMKQIMLASNNMTQEITCEEEIQNSGKLPYCIVGDTDQECSESDIPEIYLQKLKKLTAAMSRCNLFSHDLRTYTYLGFK